MGVSHPIERRDHVGRELARLFEHGIDEVFGQVAIEPLLERALEPARVLEREGDVGDRRPVGHDGDPADIN